MMRDFRAKYPGVWLMHGWLYLHVVTITVPTAMFSAPIFTSVTQKITRMIRQLGRIHNNE